MTNDGLKREIESTNVKSCSACGGSHDRLIVTSLDAPRPNGFGPPHTHAAKCPAKQQTLFMRFD